MPTYDYQCQACAHTFEEFQSMSAEILKKCPQCQKNKLKRLIGAGAGIIFKGSGFYETDYRSSQYQSDASADKKKKDDTVKKTSDTPKCCGQSDSCSKK